MNDLAEKAWEGVQAVGRQVARRPVPLLALAGFVAGALVVVAGGRLGAAPDALPITTWLDLLAPAGYQVEDHLPGTAIVLGIGVLLTLWTLVLHLAHRGRLGERQTWIVAAVWATPFALGPPLLSTDVYSSVAHGLLYRHGLDPYSHAPTRLGPLRIVSAIDPTWRGTPSTGGPLSNFVEHLAVAIAGGHALAAVVLLRTLAVVAVAVIGRLAAELAGRPDARRADAVALTCANPAVLLYLVSGAHLDAVMIALLLGALLAANQRRWTVAIVLVCLAAGVKPIALVALPALVVAHAVGQRGHVAWRTLGRDVATAAITLLAATYAVGHDGLGWIRNVSETTHEHTFWAPANLISDMIAPVVSGASYDDLAIGGRGAALLAAVTAVAYLLVTVLNRPLERTVGYLLLAIGLLSPTIYPWYLLWGVLCLAANAASGPAANGAANGAPNGAADVTGLRRDWLIAISSAAAILVLPGFTTREAQVITAAGLVVILAVLATRQHLRRQARRRVPEPAGSPS